VEIDFGYTDGHPGALSPIFAKNPVPGSMTRVLTRTALRFPGTQGPPANRDQFDFVIPLDQPFAVQTHRTRHFLWETRLFSHTGGTGSAPFGCWFDAHRDSRASRVYAVGSVTRPDGLRDDAMLVTSLLGAGGGRIAPDLQAAGVPQSGRSFDLVLRHVPPLAPVALCHGGSSRSWGTLSLPFDLAPFGAPGCALLHDWSLILPVAAGANGQLELRFPVPGDASLVSATFYSQFVVLDAAANALGITVSNAGEAIVGG
jgi:hypothetical protein